MKKFVDVVKQEIVEMHPPNEENMLECLPVLCPEFNSTINRITQEQARPEAENPPPANNANPARRANNEEG